MTSATTQVLRYQANDAVRSRWLVTYTLFFLITTEGLLRFGGGGENVVLSLINVVLLLIPLVTLILGTVYLYNAREFIELLLAQPVARSRLFRGLYLGLALPLTGAFVTGVGLPCLARVAGPSRVDPGMLAALLLTGSALTLVFAALAFVIATCISDRLRGLGVAIAVWLALALLYDGAVLIVVVVFGDYAIERPLLAATFANPIDLARVALLMRLDVSALMGYTGAVFQRFFGSGVGVLAAWTALAAWLAVPVWISARSFKRKDF